MAHRDRSIYLDSFLILAFFGTLYFFYLGSRPLFVPDEGRYAEIAREMLIGGDWITPHLNGIKYFEKPTLFYWLEALSMQIFGVNLWAVRSINAVLSLLLCWVTYLTLRSITNRTHAIYSAVILGSSLLFITMGRMVTLDLSVTVFITFSLYAYVLSVERDARWLYAAFASAALAVLTKGLIGILLPLLIIGASIYWTKHRPRCKSVSLLFGVILFLGLSLPWHAAVQYLNPEFFDFYVIEQHVLRYLSKEVGHYQPIWYFLPCVILGFFPWIFFLPQGLLQSIKSKGFLNRTLQLWAGTIFLFFSLSKSKLIPYILPVFPPLAILTAGYLAKCHGQPTKGLKIGYCLIAIFSLLLPFAAVNFMDWSRFEEAAHARTYLLRGLVILSIGSILAFSLSFKNSWVAFLSMLMATASFLLFLFVAMQGLDNRSILPLAEQLKPHLEHTDTVVTYDRYYQDLPFYLGRHVTVLNWRNELSFGAKHQKGVDWMWSSSKFWQAWHGQKRVYVLIAKRDFEKISPSAWGERFIVISTHNDNILAKNMN